MSDEEFRELVVNVLVAAALIALLMVAAAHMGDTHPPL